MDPLVQIHAMLAPRRQACCEGYEANKQAFGKAVLRDVTTALRLCAQGKPVNNIVTTMTGDETVVYSCLPEFKGLRLLQYWGRHSSGSHVVFDSVIAPAVTKAGFATAKSARASFVLTSKEDVPTFTSSA
jgi:hypothetical protein